MATRETDLAGRRRRPRKGDLKEAAILDTAWKLLVEKPLGQITIEDLAKGAGISRSSFYFYFDSKEAVLRALGARVAEDIRGHATAFFDRPGPWSYSDIRRGVSGYLARWKANAERFRANMILELSDASLRDFWVEVTNGIVREAGELVDQRRDAGELPPGPPESQDLVRVLFAMLLRIGYEITLRPHARAEEQRLIDAASVVIHRSLMGGEPPSTHVRSPRARSGRGRQA